LVLALRQARRQRVRAVAIVATLTIPVAAVTAVDVVTRSTHLTAIEQLDRQLGPASAVVTWSGFGHPLAQAPNPENGVWSSAVPNNGFETSKPGPISLPRKLLPPGSTATGEADAFPFFISAAGGSNIELRGVDLRAQAPRAGVVVRSGRVPAATDEVALSPAAAGQLQAHLGSTLRVPGSSQALRVVGIVSDRYAPGTAEGFTLTGTALWLQDSADSAFVSKGVTTWYLTSPGGVSWRTVEAFNARGWTVASRQVVEHPPPAYQVPFDQLSAGSQASGFEDAPTAGSFGASARDTTRIGAGVLGAMLVLEVALMAGPAFAVGARRRRHDLAIVAAGGGTRSQLMAIVVADGVVLGTMAAVLGAGLGIAGGAAWLAGIRQWGGRIPGSVTIRGWEVAAIALLALVSGLLAALLPALSASRVDTAQVLRGRQARARLSWWPALFGVAALAAALWLGLSNVDEASNGGFPVPLIAAAALAEIGFVLLTPVILVLVGRTARHLPIWPRLAVRDASRNRSSAAPAVAAIIAVVAAASATLVYGSSVAAHDRVSWLPSMPTGDATAYLTNQPGIHVNGAKLLTQVRAQLPGAAVVEVNGGTSNGRAVVLVGPGCPAPHLQFQSGNSGFGYSFSSGTPLCDRQLNIDSQGSYVVDDGVATDVMLGGTVGAQAESALRAGIAVVFDPSLVANGRVHMELGPGKPSAATIPAVAVASSIPIPVAPIIFPPSVAQSLRLRAGASELYLKDATAQPAQRLAAADRVLEAQGIYGFSVQAPYHNTIGGDLVAVAGADLVLVVAATVAATALVSIDAGGDLAILGAIGAPLLGRRRLAMSRASVICAIGSITGVIAGSFVGIELVRRLRDQNIQFTANNQIGSDTFAYPLHLPWVHLAVVVVAAPLLAAAVAAAFVGRSRQGLDRHLPQL
jgi:putative ABC transport system permease protein